MAGAEESFECARKAFRNAAASQSIVTMRTHAELGLALLDSAAALSAVVEFPLQRPASGSSDK
jgi:hypothetical protein